MPCHTEWVHNVRAARGTAQTVTSHRRTCKPRGCNCETVLHKRDHKHRRKRAAEALPPATMLPDVAQRCTQSTGGATAFVRAWITISEPPAAAVTPR